MCRRPLRNFRSRLLAARLRRPLLVLAAAGLPAIAAAAAGPAPCPEPILAVDGKLAAGCDDSDPSAAAATGPLLQALRRFASRTGADEARMHAMRAEMNRILVAFVQPPASQGISATTLEATPATGDELRPTLAAISSWLAGEVDAVSSAPQLSRAVVAWRRRYRELFDSWIPLPGQHDDSESARRMIGRFEFARAANLLDRILAAQQADDPELAALTAYRDAQTCDLIDRGAEAEALYREAHRLAPDDGDFLDGYAGFLRRDHRIPEAIVLAEGALAQVGDDVAAPNEVRERRARILLLLGTLRHADGRDADAGQALVAAREIQGDLVIAAPAVFQTGLAQTLEALGDLDQSRRDLRRAEESYVRARDIRRRLAASNPTAFEGDLARTLDKLGLVYRLEDRDGEAQLAWLEAREIRQRLAAADPIAFGADLDQTQQRLDGFAQRTAAPDPAEQGHLAARDILRRLVDEDRAYFEPDLAATLDNLGLLYRRTRRPEDAEQAFREAVEIDRRSAASDASRFEPVLARTLDNLGDLYAEQSDFDRAERCYSESVDLLKRYAAGDAILRTRRLLYLQDLDRIYAAANDESGRDRVRRELTEYLTPPDDAAVQ
jgi:tetratricopeptide (TPR) repeat protein